MLSVSSSESSKRRVLVHGLYYCGRMFADLMTGNGWDFRYYPDVGIGNLVAMARALAACDLVYQIGGRRRAGKFLQAAKMLRKKKIVMHWIGSDTLLEQSAKKAAEPWILENIHHWAVSEWMVAETRALGVPCELVRIPSSYVPDAPSPMPSEFSVLVYMPDVRFGELYGLDRILEVARQLPNISFELVGLLHGPIPDPPANLRIHGRIPNLVEFYKRTSVLWRPVRHDGMPSMVLEALGHGRQVLWTYPFPGCVLVGGAADARREISRLYALHRAGKLQINSEGSEAIARGYLPQSLKQVILQRLAAIADCGGANPDLTAATEC